MTDSTPLKARPTAYKGIRMRSRTEAAYAARLDGAGLSWEYEPRCFADETGQYLPDFRVTYHDSVAYVEVKGVLVDEDVVPVQERMEVIWASEPRALLVIAITSSGDSWHCHPNQPGDWWLQRSTSYGGA